MRFQCKCGCVMWNGETPNDIEFWVYSDKRMCEELLADDTIDTVRLAGMYDYEVWKCPECKRLYIFKNGENECLCAYAPEESVK